MKLPTIPIFDIRHCYNLGYDCGKNGASITNCHFAAFASKNQTKAWEKGRDDARAGKPKRQR